MKRPSPNPKRNPWRIAAILAEACLVLACIAYTILLLNYSLLAGR